MILAQINMSAMEGISLLSVGKGLIGIVSLVLLAVLFSRNRKSIDWKLVVIGLTVQFLLAIGILFVPFFGSIFDFLGRIFIKIMAFTNEGSTFLLGGMMDVKSFGYIFAFQVLPTIIFFSALSSLLFYLGVIQRTVQAASWMLRKILKISGSEGLVLGAHLALMGQTEAPLLVKGYLSRMNASEIFLIMTAGMATIAGGVLVSYIGMLGGGDAVSQLIFAKHLLSASVMAVPGAAVFAKILFPQTEKVDENTVIEQNKIGSNFLDSIAIGTSDGLRLALNIAGMLLVFIAFVAFANFLVSKFIGSYSVSGVLLGAAILALMVFSIQVFVKKNKKKGIRIAFWVSAFLTVICIVNVVSVGMGDGFILNQYLSEISGGRYTQFNFQFIMGLLFSPLVMLMGINPSDAISVGQLLGEKTIMNEFVGYQSLATLVSTGVLTDPKTIIMSTYLLCGFANISSIGIQIGGIGSLAPQARPWLTKYGPLAVLAGTLVSCMSATMVGLLLG
ncbi:MAG TPA: nucleoside transporter C-terminal domain-containing protein [Bacteroidales bacterium]|nr:nucleoside transporter C-terminal domain-containing protein [Bacteroidales bacterium]